MKISQIQISNFRKIRSAVIEMQPSSVLVGQAGSGRSTVLEALSLVLDVDRHCEKCSIDEFDFFDRNYIDANGEVIELQVKILLNDLSDSDIIRFSDHIISFDARIRNGKSRSNDIQQIDRSSLLLPVIFIAKYDGENQEFVSGTYFDTPIPNGLGAHDIKLSLGGGRPTFKKADKQHCGFIFLKSPRTSSQLLGLSSGSLTGKLVELIDYSEHVDGLEPTAESLISAARRSKPPLTSEDVSNVLATHDLPLTPECARFILRDIAYGDQRTKTGNIIKALVQQDAGYDAQVVRHSRSDTSALMVKLISCIAAAKSSRSVSLVVEQLEEALPPHSLLKLIRLINTEMNQVIVTTNSAFVTRQFQASGVFVLGTNKEGVTYAASPSALADSEHISSSISPDIKAAALGTGILVVEGNEMASVCREASIVMARGEKVTKFSELSELGISTLPSNDVNLIPEYSAAVRSLGMLSFALFLKPEKDFNDTQIVNLDNYDSYWELSFASIECLIVEETSSAVHRRFLDVASLENTYPWHCGSYDALLHDDQEVSDLALAVLRARRGCSDDMAGLFIRQCQTVDELPATLLLVLSEMHQRIVLDQIDVPRIY